MPITVETIWPAPVDARAEQVMVAMRDGVRLATDVYLPPQPKPSPAVLVRLPYDKSGRYTFMPALAPHFLDRGYVFVVQDVRGKFRSEGETMPYLHEVEDGYDTIDWVTRQRWSNSVVGMFGDSYYGWTQWAALASGHPALRAIVPRVTSANLAAIRLGTHWDSGIPPLYAGSYLAHHWVAGPDYEYSPDWTVRPLAAVFDEAFRQIGARSAGFDAMVAQLRPIAPLHGRHPFDGREIPTLHSVGWFDNIGPDSMRDYRTLQERGRTLQYLIADSTDHENYALAQVPIRPDNDHDSNDEALERLLPAYLGPGLDFFDAFLQDRRAAPPPVRWHLGHDDWHRGPRWPPPQSRPWLLYLSHGTQATRSADGGLLARRAPAAADQARWTHDPAHLVPSTVSNPFAFINEDPDERPVQERGDVATFTSEPAASPVDLAGPVEARLAVSSTGPSAHVYAKLCDVTPGGTARMLARGQAFIADARQEAPVGVYLGHTGYRLRAGHRLRLHVACSDFPLYLPYPGDGRNPWQATRGTANGIALQTGGSSPSHLTVHVMTGRAEQ